MERPLIMVTNDDAVDAPGLRALVECAARLGDVYVVAPALPQSAKSSALTEGAGLRIKELTAMGMPDGVRVFTVSGTPVDCVKLGLHAIVPRKPDFLFSGINHGSNSGNAITYSGTMGAVLEGCMAGITSVGFSLCHHSVKADFALSMPLVDKIAAKVVHDGLPGYVALNVNIPPRIVPHGARVCRAARGHWSEEYRRYLDPSGVPFYWLTGRFVNEEEGATDTDEYWLSQGYISVVPVTPDQTAAAEIAGLSRFDL